MVWSRKWVSDHKYVSLDYDAWRRNKCLWDYGLKL